MNGPYAVVALLHMGTTSYGLWQLGNPILTESSLAGVCSWELQASWSKSALGDCCIDLNAVLTSTLIVRLRSHNVYCNGEFNEKMETTEKLPKVFGHVRGMI